MVKIFLWEMCPKRQTRKNSGHSLLSMAQSQNAPSSKTLPSVRLPLKLSRLSHGKNRGLVKLSVTNAEKGSEDELFDDK